MNLSDAHCHYHFPALAPHREKVFADLASAGVRRAVVNGTCEDEWPGVSALAREHAWVVPSYGVHPWDAGNRSEEHTSELQSH